MPPPPRRPGPPRRRSPVAVAVSTALALGLSGAVLWSVVRFASENPDKANLGSRVFNVGRAERLAEEVDDRGPFLFQDPLSTGTGRNLYIQHLSDDPEQGWSAIEARLPEDPTCLVEWSRQRERFVDCEGGSHPPDGGDLVTYPGTVEDGQVRVDLRTTPPSTEQGA